MDHQDRKQKGVAAVINTAVREEKTSATHVPGIFSWALMRNLLQGIMECCGFEQAGVVAYRGGYLAGEDFAYNRMDLEDAPGVFYQKLVEQSGRTGFPRWQIRGSDKKTGCLHLSFESIRGCRGEYGRQMPLACMFMKGYLAGILDNYSGHTHDIVQRCGQTVQKRQRNSQCSFVVTPVNTNAKDWQKRAFL